MRHEKEKSARLFLRYAFPCAGITLARGAISQKMFNTLKEKAKTKETISWKRLEKIFPSGVRRLRTTAQTYNINPYSSEAVLKYFLKHHNEYIKNNEGSYAYAPEALKKLCRVEKAQVIQKGGDYYVVKIGAKKRPVSSNICPHARVGDMVSVHYGYAVEKLKQI